jgi:hypothetical protein
MGVDDVPGRLYVFPDHAGKQANPPSLTGTPTDTPTNSPTDAPGGGATTATETGGATTRTTPGFGLGAAATALGLAAWRTLRRDDPEKP